MYICSVSFVTSERRERTDSTQVHVDPEDIDSSCDLDDDAWEDPLAVEECLDREEEQVADDEVADSMHQLPAYQVTIDFVASPKNEQGKDQDIQWMLDVMQRPVEERPELSEVDDAVRRSLLKCVDNLAVCDGVLFHRREEDDGSQTWRYVVPGHQMAVVLVRIHGTIFGGHLGINKTTEKFVSRFMRPQFRQVIKEYIQQCDVCQRVKAANRNARAPLRPIRPVLPLELVTTDLTALLPETAQVCTRVTI